jgi:predicted transcriptional regulator
MSRLKTLTVKLPSSLSAKVARLAKRRRATKSDIVREALEKLAGRETPSFSEAAAEFIGAAQGPGDLSTNPKYMRDYGR